MFVLLIMVVLSCICMFGYCVMDTVNAAWETGDFFTVNTAKNVFTIILIIYFVWTWWKPSVEATF